MSKPLDSIAELDAMRMGVDYRFQVRIRSYSVSLRPLSIIETIQVTERVAELIDSKPERARTRIMEHTLLAKETLKQASTLDVDSKEHPKLTDYILDRMTADELDAMFKEYVAICDRVNPVLEEIEPLRLNMIVEDLRKKKGDRLDSVLIELSRWELVNICRSLLGPKSD